MVINLWCDNCGDITVAAKPILVTFPDGAKLEILLCLDCWKEFEKSSRKLKVARMLKILKE